MAEQTEGEAKKNSTVLEAEEEIRKLLIAERRKQITQRRALRIVLELAKRRVTKDFLCVALNFVEPQHWDDAIDERNAEKLCGYVFCSKKPILAEGKKQRYRICSKTNKVYDMQDYERFCSVWCAKAANHVREQIPDSSIIGRERASRLRLTFLDEDASKEEAVKEDEEKKEEQRKKEPKTPEVPEEEVVKEKREKPPAKKAPKPQTEGLSLPRVPPLEGAKSALRAWITADSLAWMTGHSVTSSGDEAAAYRTKVGRFFGRGTKEGEASSLYLPLVDSVSQDAIRRRIVGAKLDTCLGDLAPTLKLETSAIRAPLRLLLSTFAFTATNIVLRPREWRAVSLLLLGMLSEREAAVRDALNSEEAAVVVRDFADDGELGLQEIVAECAMLSLD